MPQLITTGRVYLAQPPLYRIDIGNEIVTDRVINELMGKDPSARFRFIMERAEEAVELDV
jgi:DNA gyrase subunit B/topoisomerase-4 subunit B